MQALFCRMGINIYLYAMTETHNFKNRETFQHSATFLWSFS